MMNSSTEVRQGPKQGYCCCSCRSLDCLDSNMSHDNLFCGNTGAIVFGEQCLSSGGTSDSTSKSSGSSGPPCNFCFNEMAAALDVVELSGFLSDEEDLDGTQADIIHSGADSPPGSVNKDQRKRKEVSADGSDIIVEEDNISVEAFFLQTRNCDIVDPMENFFVNLIDASDVKNLSNQKADILRWNLFNLLCAIVYSGDGGLTSGKCMDNEQQFINLQKRFDDLLSNILKQSYYVDNIFRHLPNQEWPSGFLDWIYQKQDAAPSRTFIKRFKIDTVHTDPKRQKLLFFGSVVKDTALNVKKVVTNDLNPLWKDSFTSGFNHTGIYLYCFLFNE